MWGIALQRNGGIPMARQLYQALRGRMTDGRLKSGEALPSTREMARQLGISRNTACEAYAMLSDEGYVVSRQGAPTRVAEGLALESAAPAGPEKAFPPPARRYAADFRTGKPELRRFPVFLWRQLLSKGAEELEPDRLDYGGQAGLAALRREIAAWLLRSRGLTERPQDIFVTAGTSQVLFLVPSLPNFAGGAMLVEDPCHADILQAWRQMGIVARGVPVDEHGLRTEILDSLDIAGVRAVYVTPSHQFPLGGVLPAGRRAELIRFARKRGLYVIEDDYDNEFRYFGAPVAPLRALDAGRVIYTGTFSKTLFPALRIGFVILPEPLQSQWLAQRKHADIQNPPFEQAALAEFLRTRKFDRHVQRMRRLYGQRREILLREMRARFGEDGCRPIGDAAGLHVALRFPGMCFDGDFERRARERGIRVKTAEYYGIEKGMHEDKLILGFGHLEPEEIRNAAALLYEFITGQPGCAGQAPNA